MIRRIFASAFLFVAAFACLAQAQNTVPGIAAGFRPGFQFVQSGSSPTPGPAPINMANFATTPSPLYSTIRPSTYPVNGPVVDVVCVTGGATGTINYLNNAIDMGAVSTLCGSSLVEVSKWYDVSGVSNLDCTASSNRPALNPINVVNGVQALSFDGSNGTPVITRQCAMPAGVAIDIANNAIAMVGRSTTSGGSSSSMATYSIASATAADWRVFQGLSYVATSTQTQAINVPVNTASLLMSRGATSGTSGAAGTTLSMAERTFTRAATTGTGTSAGGIVGNTTTGTSRLFAEVVTLAFFPSQQPGTAASNIQTTLEAPFSTTVPIQRTFTDSIFGDGDSIWLGTGGTLNQTGARQIYSLLKRPVRMFNNGAFGAVAESFINGVGVNHWSLWSGWSQTTSIYIAEQSTNTFAQTGTSSGLSAMPTIAAGGTGCAANSTFNATITGGTGTASVVSVSTNGSGVVTSINSIFHFGIYTVPPVSPNAATGSTCTGLSLNVTYSPNNTYQFMRQVMIQTMAFAKAAGTTKAGFATTIPRQSWIAARTTASISSGVLNVTAVTSGTIAVGQNVNVAGTAIPVGKIASFGTGTGGVGTYNLDTSATVASGVTYMGSAAWVEACAYSADGRANYATTFGADYVVDVAGVMPLGSLITTDNPAYYGDTGLHPNNVGWATMAPTYTAQLNAMMP